MSSSANQEPGQAHSPQGGAHAMGTAEGNTQKLTGAEHFIERNRKIFLYTLLGILLVVTGYVLYRTYVVQPREEEAQQQIFPAEQKLAKGEYQVALEGDGNVLGFNQIIADYGSTKSGNLAHYYAAICHRELGNQEKVLEHLKAFKSSNRMLSPMKHGMLGDCYLELERPQEALKEYTKAVAYRDNELTAPLYLMRKGMLEEKMGQWKEALTSYRLVKEGYPRSIEARDVEKDIARAEQQVK